MPSGDSLSSGLEDGRLPNVDSVLQVRSSTVTDGPSSGCRAIDIRVQDGIDLRLLPDRGFDLGPAWYRGKPLAWVSRVGETAPLSTLSGEEWASGFGGGMMVTCGLRNVGRPAEGHGLHGRYSHLSATVIGVERHLDGDSGWVEARAEIVDAEAIGGGLRLERTIRTWSGRGHVEIRDVTTNLGPATEPAPILYHFNFGFPLWAEEARLQIPSTMVKPRDPASEVAIPAWDRPPPVTSAPERVLEHVFADDDEWGSARLANPGFGIGVSVRWRKRELPRFHQWIHPAPGVYALGLEPANCSTLGRSHDRQQGQLPLLEPGESRETIAVLEAEVV